MNEQMNEWIGGKGKLSYLRMQLINIEGMNKLGNHHLATPTIMVQT